MSLVTRVLHLLASRLKSCLERKLPLLTNGQERLLDDVNVGDFIRFYGHYRRPSRELVERIEQLVDLGLVRRHGDEYDTTARGRLYLHLRYLNGPGPQEEFIARCRSRLVGV